MASLCHVLNLVVITLFFISLGYGSLALTEGSHCAVHTHSTLILFYIVICVSSMCNLIILRYLIVRMIKQKTFWIFTTSSKSLFPIYLSLAIASDTLLAIFHIVYAEQKLIGQNIWTTLAAMFAVFPGHMGLIHYLFVILSNIRRRNDFVNAEDNLKLEENFNSIAFWANFLGPVSFIVSGMPFLGLPFPNHRDPFLMIFVIGTATVGLGWGFLAVKAFSYLLKPLSKHINEFEQVTDDLKTVYMRLNRACRGIKILTSGTFILSLIFGTSEYFLIRSTYVFIAVMLTLPMGCLLLIVTVSTVVPNNSPNNSLVITIKSTSGKFKLINSIPYKRHRGRVTPCSRFTLMGSHSNSAQRNVGMLSPRHSNAASDNASDQVSEKVSHTAGDEAITKEMEEGEIPNPNPSLKRNPNFLLNPKQLPYL
jgi:hypothetical protein